MVLFREHEISVRTLEDKDIDLLVKWLSNPIVLEFYEGRDRPHNMELVKKHFYENREQITQCIIQYDTTEIGYIQFYLIDDEEIEKYDYKDYKGNIYGMDQFIGESEYWNRGIGSRLIKETVKYLIKVKGANKIVMDPQTWNTRALRVYEKNGFVKKKYLEKHEWHEGEFRDCWLIEYDAGGELKKEGVTEMNDTLLIEPSTNYKEEYIEMVKEWEETGEMVPFVLKFDYSDFNLMIQELINLRDIPRVDSTKVNSSTFWLVDRNKKVIGVVNIRHKLNEGLLYRGGHIGYGIRPSERMKGNATEILKQALVKAKEIGINKALITCDKDNIGSVRTITNNGGILDSEEVVNGIEIQRYWIENN